MSLFPFIVLPFQKLFLNAKEIATNHGIEFSSEIQILVSSQCIIVRVLLYYLESIKHFIIYYGSIQCASTSAFFDNGEKITEVQKFYGVFSFLWCSYKLLYIATNIYLLRGHNSTEDLGNVIALASY